MDRVIVYPGAVPLETDILSAERYAMIFGGFILAAAYGSNTIVSGLACTPTVPASLQVTVGPGSIISLQTVDPNAFSSLLADTSALVKMGINLAPQSFTLTAPTTSGQSVNYLLEASFQEADGSPVELPYYDAANPSDPYSGPGNDGVAQNTQRTQRASVQLKAGTPANTGTQTTPAVDNGWVGLYVITVNYNQTQVTAPAIATYPNAPFLAQFLQSHHGGVPGQAPKINLTTEVQNPLPLANLPTSGRAMITNRQVFTTSGNFTVPAGVTKVDVLVIGAGSGASGCSPSLFASPSGAGGGWCRKLCAVTPGQVIPVTVGTGGPGSAAAVASTSGGTSSFGSFCNATGGNPAGGPSTPFAGGGPGAGTGGDINGAGDFGSDGSATAPTGSYWPGISGASLFGGRVRAGAEANGGKGATGASPGAGGGAVYAISGGISATGGDGALGIVIVEW